MWLCEGCHVLVHQLVREGDLNLGADMFFSEGRAAIYARRRDPVDSELG